MVTSESGPIETPEQFNSSCGRFGTPQFPSKSCSPIQNYEPSLSVVHLKGKQKDSRLGDWKSVLRADQRDALARQPVAGATPSLLDVVPSV